MMHRSGFVAIIGRPNVGKSTLLNALIGEKVAIVTERPQTTRNQIRAVLTRDDAQIIFIDTPGLHKPKHKLGSVMVQKARNTIKEVDLIFFMVEAHRPPGYGDKQIAELLQATRAPLYLLLNKSDLGLPDELHTYKELYEKMGTFKEVFALSALQETNLNSLINATVKELPEGPQFYPPGMITDQPEQFIVSEIIREKIIPLTRQEIPFSIAVVVEELNFRKDRELIDIRADILVERKSQAGIVIGKNGSMLKEIGIMARQELEAIFGEQVYLNLHVKVKKDWRSDDRELSRLGYTD
ncbi:MAG: GTPase Era [Bacillota bacterium]